MSQKHFWSGVAVGSGAVVGAMFAAGLLGTGGNSRIIRLEKSVQIGADLPTVFRAWSHFERLPQYCSYITHVRNIGNDRSEWTANVDGHVFHWDAEVTQVIANQVIGWKSVGGSQHSGRIMFSPIGKDTLVHVQMNYVPPTIIARPVLAAISGRIEGYLEQALRDFKRELETLGSESEHLNDQTDFRERAELLPPNVTVGNFGQQRREPSYSHVRTGTFGSSEDPNANPVYGNPENSTVDFTRPPEDNSLRNT